MKKLLYLSLLFISATLIAQENKPNYVADNYTKKEVHIKMRDGAELFTVIYSPKDVSKKYPIIMQRTPYNAAPYGANDFKRSISPSETMMKEGYIVVYQDVRGRWMSDGLYDNMRAFIPNKKTKKDIDEASDTYDTIDWLVKNTPNNNGNVGVWGISYPGFYSTYSLLSNHPALKAVSPQACISDFFFDDFHHNGAYLLSYWKATPLFGIQKTERTTKSWYQMPELGTKDDYQFFLDAGPLSNLDKYYGKDNEFWQQLKDHSSYDDFWQKRGILQHLKDIKPAVMTVGGFFDAEDLYGPLNTYQAIEKSSKNYNTIVMGPWSHGDWARNSANATIGNINFGDSISGFYQKNIEANFFRHFLKNNGKGENKLPEAYMFDTGAKEWKTYDAWPPKNTEKQDFYLQGSKLSRQGQRNFAFEEFVSDPKKPVPFTEDINQRGITPRKYMTDDQRFAARRPDVLVFETSVLEDDTTLAGDILAKLQVATTGTDADWVVKVIDVFPADAPENKEMAPYLKMSNYHMMVRSEVMRGRFRNSFITPQAFVPNEKTAVNIKLQDVMHTFKKGHKIQIQIQSTWFPLIDLNPQTFVDNIFYAKPEDFKKQTHRVYNDSTIEFTVLKP
ncbi:CocE/NonD family hydrolase [Flavobacterium sp. F-380]|uniref:CocE/NonD family hydrolase n=1 Tax=Flavobacterium kayseriense TaxID=2764714 RepID=A0ABR7J9W1_9FLAO|nr:CocE/NonD family hydrolase [Flavobacterium kayseriense]MBC5842168.1 CocE/NonD family hydrolase [Flavobacterium kayseriense]MBC5848698.1 CocE/NonD family hydrolase [Flavobacterium kayseriense]